MYGIYVNVWIEKRYEGYLGIDGITGRSDRALIFDTIEEANKTIADNKYENSTSHKHGHITAFVCYLGAHHG